MFSLWFESGLYTITIKMTMKEPKKKIEKRMHMSANSELKMCTQKVKGHRNPANWIWKQTATSWKTLTGLTWKRCGNCWLYCWACCCRSSSCCCCRCWCIRSRFCISRICFCFCCMRMDCRTWKAVELGVKFVKPGRGWLLAKALPSAGNEDGCTVYKKSRVETATTG